MWAKASSSCSSCLWLKVVRWRLLAGEGKAPPGLLRPAAVGVSPSAPFLSDPLMSVFRREEKNESEAPAPVSRLPRTTGAV